MGLLSNLWSGAQRLGSSGIWQRVGDTAKSIGLGAARFVSQNHAPLAGLLKGIGDASGSPFLKNVGNLAMAASGAYGVYQRNQAFNAQAAQARASSQNPSGVYDAANHRVT